ncbi:E3 ubiquitin-protein ligase RNF169 isoform X1 [Hippoglossus hippoglossus]|uniref:E3 ubiquitin-protein ligase RNF169 isoform X1 n=1 Tax=Hippoglossus hippoglossus TaxID=8267 RepID=UPI00148C7910|nr:E3 ubiquitin-protein ligase RNF169 isoform X1 [Hippoglossus hippoglossus]
MAAARSAERPGTAASAAAGRSRSGAASGPGSSPPEDEGTKCAACAEGPSGGSPPCGHPACPLCRARRHPATEERLRRRSDPEKSSSRTGRRGRCSPGREFFVCPALFAKSADVSSGASGKHKLLLCDDREEFRRRKDDSLRRDGIGVLSDSENEEPIRKIRNVSAFVRKTKASLVVAGGAQRSRSCTDPVEVGGGKLKVTAQPAMMDQVGISHSYTAGILLSSENSRSVSAPIAAPDRRLTWRAVITSSSSSSTPLVLPLPQPERSISPESNDSISEELNHFKPIVCSPCTPPKRLPDGRLLEPTIVKSTPRNLTRGLQKSTSYEASPAVLQKWRQIELDRQNLKVNSKATLTSPITEVHNKTSVGEDATKTRVSSAGDGLTSTNKRRLLFDPPAGDTDTFQKQSVMIRVPAIRYSSDATFRGSSDYESTVAVPESCSAGVVFSRKQSFSPYSKNSGFQSCKLVPKDSQSPRKESDSTIHNQSTSRRGKKRKQKTKHLDSDRDADMKRSRPGSQDAFDERYICQIQQERQDRVLALKLQRQFDLENQTVNRRRSPDTYFLRSWMSNQNRRRRGLRRSRRINKKY